ncbi:PadR family transcriptional regulator [Agrococcus jejuensis]|uniref:Transcriptional regulator PadR-like family protein n=1 Tax=Agrococcus jejuensis TaxID=399736 RepID=A0A1G8H9E9_9MICO|nr:PadR family transcriptional regulator [Agrococcus jejuensis]SDI03257.1 Transcriptional regulator PadR-like family protein [Agrococcus jejuensis]
MLTPLQIATLGVLAEEPRHPYDCYRLLMHRRADRVVRIKTGTLYHSIARLEAEGLVAEVGTDREGNRPERTTYRITDDGRSALEAQLRTMLAEPVEEHPPFRLAISEAHNLPRDAVVAALGERVAALEAAATEMADAADDLGSTDLPEAVWLELALELRLTRAEADWTRETAARIDSGDIPWDLVFSPERRAAQQAALDA